MIETVTGALRGKISGKILMHEHICCISNDMLHTFGKRWLDKDVLIEHAAEILKELKCRYGVEMIVDGTPIDSGRDIRVLNEVSKKSGIKIVASTGLYSFPSMITYGRDEKEIASWFLEEYENGMEGTNIKPGILKCACDDFGITEDNVKRIGAMGTVQSKTELPLYVHCMHQENTVYKALKILENKGANPEKTVIGHVGLRFDAEYLKNIINMGYYVCVDQCHCVPQDAEKISKTLVKLCEMGLSDKILLSNDACIYCDFGSGDNVLVKKDEISKGWGYIFEYIYPKFLQYGGNKIVWDKMMCENPLKIIDN